MMTKIKINSKMTLLHAICVMALLSCSKESNIGGQDPTGEPTTINISTRVANDGTTDEIVASLRVMTFLGSADADRIEFNILKSGLTTDQATLSLRIGTRTVVFISNETAAMATALGGVSTLGDLKNIDIAWTAFTSTDPIPAYARYDGVTIAKGSGSTAIITGAGTEFAGGKWKISLERLAVKVKSVTLTATSNQTAFNGITFGNLPASVPLVPTQKYNTSGAAQLVTIPLTSFTTPTFSGGVWTATLKPTTRIILPAKEFATITSQSDAVTLTAIMSSGASPTGSIKHSNDPLDYTLHRNTEYDLTASISSSDMKVDVTYHEWITQELPATIGRELNVSNYDVTLDSKNQYFIYFTSNQPKVSVDAPTIKIYNGVQTTEANTTISLEDFAFAANFNYTYDASMGRGNGWIRIVSKSAFESYSVRKITLNAGGLKRQIIINKPGPVFAMSNIVRHSDGTLYFAEDAAALTTNRTGQNLTWAQGLMFRWGSLVGLEGVTTGAWDASKVVFVPAEYNGVNATTWDVSYPPYLTVEVGEYDSSQDEFTSAYPILGYDPASGKGDICRYISDKGWVKGKWRIPTGKDYKTFFETGIKDLSNLYYYGMKYPLFNSTFIAQTTIDKNGKDPINYGYYIGPGVLTTSSTTITDKSIIPFPNSGYRNLIDDIDNGKLFFVGTTGVYWSSSASYSDNGMSHELIRGRVWNQSYARSYGLSVRCIQDL